MSHSASLILSYEWWRARKEFKVREKHGLIFLLGSSLYLGDLLQGIETRVGGVKKGCWSRSSKKQKQRQD